MAALFGFNLTITVIGMLLLKKIIPSLAIPPRFLKGFYRFIPPSEQMLRDHTGEKEKKLLGNAKQRKNQKKSDNDKKDYVVPKVN